MRWWIALGLLAVAGGGCGSSAGRGDGTGGGTDGDPTGTEGGQTDGVDETGGPPVGPEATFELRINDQVPAPLTLEMNKDEVTELFGDRADEILLLELDSTPLLTNTLTTVAEACGLAWQFDDPDPNHDCTLTPLGQTFVGPDGTWQTSPEYAMVRLLTMTPANVDVSGTSSEGLAELANALSWIIDDYGQILADVLAIPRTQPVITTESLVASFRDNFVASHPAVGEGGMLGLTLADALSNLATLTERYGPMDAHPGIVDPSFPVQGEVFGPDFKMIAVADSNLRLVEGVDADQGEEPGKGYASVVVDQVGPSYEDELEFDFTDPERFRVEGLIENLTIDMRFRLGEYPQFVPSCTGSEACQGNLPGAPTSPQSVWSRSPWDFEYLVTDAAYRDYVALPPFSVDYLLGSASVDVGQNGNPLGWIEYFVFLGLGNPPEDQFVWETILEVAQVRLHDSGFQSFPEGVELAFTIEDIPCGLSGSEAAEAVRPYLQEQASDISDFLLGDYKEENDTVDFYYRRAEDGRAYVYFVAAEDRPDGAAYGYANPGFFEDSALASKASATAVSGVADTAHEKLALPAGESRYYFEDDTGTRYRARFVVGDDDSAIEVSVSALL